MSSEQTFLWHNPVLSRNPTDQRRLPLNAWIQSLISRVRTWFRQGSGHPASAGVDTELLDVFLLELTDILQSLDSALARWRSNPSDIGALKQLRRGFHTIKGSAPLVGADMLGNLCKDLERLMAEFQDRPAKVTPIAISTLAQAIALLPAFVESVRTQRPAPTNAAAVHQRVVRLIER